MLGRMEVRNNIPRDGRHCDLCGCSFPAVRCDKCSSQIFCLSCDDMYHRHPKRRFHLRKAVDPQPTSVQARPVLPMKVSQTAPGDPSKMPLPPPRKKKPVKSFFDTFRRGSPSSDVSPTLPKKEYNWTDRLGSIKKFMSNRPLPPLPNGNSGSPQEDSSSSEVPSAKHDMSFIHKRVDEKPPQLPERSMKPQMNPALPDRNYKENMPPTQNYPQTGSSQNGHVNGGITNDFTDIPNFARNRGFSLGEEQNHWNARVMHSHAESQRYKTVNKHPQHGLMQPGMPGYPTDAPSGMHQSSSATNLHALPPEGMPLPPGMPPHYAHYPMNVPPQYPYPMYPQYPNYPQYFGSSWANLAGPPPTTTEGDDVSDQSEASSRHFSGKRYPFRKRAKRSQSVMVDRMGYPGQYYPFGPFPPGFGPGGWTPPHLMDTPPSPSGSIRSLNKVGRTRHRRRKASSDEDDEDEEFSMSSSPVSRPKSSSSERPRATTRKSVPAKQESSSDEEEEEEEREDRVRERSRNQKFKRKGSDTRRTSSPGPKSINTDQKQSTRNKRNEPSSETPESPMEQPEPNRKDENLVARGTSGGAVQSDQDHSKTPWIPTTEWHCRHCTFLNPPNARICQVCCKTATRSPEAKEISDLSDPCSPSPASIGGRPPSDRSGMSCSSPEKKGEQDDEDGSSKKDKRDMAILNSALDEAEKEISRGLEELMKLKEDINNEAPSRVSSRETLPPTTPKPETPKDTEQQPAKPVYKSSGKMRSNILEKLTSKAPISSKTSVSTSTSTEIQTGNNLNRRPSSSSTTSETFNSPTAQSPEVPSLNNNTDNKLQNSNFRRDSSCQTQQDSLVDYLQRKKAEEEAAFMGRPSYDSNAYTYNRLDAVVSPNPYMYADRNFGHGLMQRSHSRASLFAARYNDPMDYVNPGFGFSPMYRSVSRGSLSGDYPDSRFSEFHNLRKPDFYLSMEELVERRRQETMRSQGLELVRMIREAEQQGFTADDIQVALNNCGKQNPLDWLQENWRNMVDNVVALSTNYGNDKKENNDIGIVADNEARDALRLHKGNIWAAVTECVEGRQRKFLELSAKGKFSRKEVVGALSSSQGDVEAAYSMLMKSSSKPFLMRIWGAGEGVQNQDGALTRSFEDLKDIQDYKESFRKVDDGEESEEIWEEDDIEDEEDEWIEEDDDKHNSEHLSDSNIDSPADKMKTPESEDRSEYCDAFGSGGDDRSLSSPSSDDILLVIPDQPPPEETKRRTSFLSKLAALRKEGKQKKPCDVKKTSDSNDEALSSACEEQYDAPEEVVDQGKSYGPLNILRNTISAIKDSVTGSSSKSEKKSLAMPERRTIIVRGKFAQELLDGEASPESAKLTSLKAIDPDEDIFVNSETSPNKADNGNEAYDLSGTKKSAVVEVQRATVTEDSFEVNNVKGDENLMRKSPIHLSHRTASPASSDLKSDNGMKNESSTFDMASNATTEMKQTTGQVTEVALAKNENTFDKIEYKAEMSPQIPINFEANKLEDSLVNKNEVGRKDTINVKLAEISSNQFINDNAESDLSQVHSDARNTGFNSPLHLTVTKENISPNPSSMQQSKLDQRSATASPSIIQQCMDLNKYMIDQEAARNKKIETQSAEIQNATILESKQLLEIESVSPASKDFPVSQLNDSILKSASAIVKEPLSNSLQEVIISESKILQEETKLTNSKDSLNNVIAISYLSTDTLKASFDDGLKTKMDMVEDHVKEQEKKMEEYVCSSEIDSNKVIPILDEVAKTDVEVDVVSQATNSSDFPDKLKNIQYADDDENENCSIERAPTASADSQKLQVSESFNAPVESTDNKRAIDNVQHDIILENKPENMSQVEPVLTMSKTSHVEPVLSMSSMSHMEPVSKMSSMSHVEPVSTMSSVSDVEPVAMTTSSKDIKGEAIKLTATDVQDQSAIKSEASDPIPSTSAPHEDLSVDSNVAIDPSASILEGIKDKPLSMEAETSPEVENSTSDVEKISLPVHVTASEISPIEVKDETSQPSTDSTKPLTKTKSKGSTKIKRSTSKASKKKTSDSGSESQNLTDNLSLDSGTKSPLKLESKEVENISPIEQIKEPAPQLTPKDNLSLTADSPSVAESILDNTQQKEPSSASSSSSMTTETNQEPPSDSINSSSLVESQSIRTEITVQNNSLNDPVIQSSTSISDDTLSESQTGVEPTQENAASVSDSAPENSLPLSLVPKTEEIISQMASVTPTASDSTPSTSEQELIGSISSKDSKVESPVSTENISLIKDSERSPSDAIGAASSNKPSSPENAQAVNIQTAETTTITQAAATVESQHTEDKTNLPHGQIASKSTTVSPSVKPPEPKLSQTSTESSITQGGVTESVKSKNVQQSFPIVLSSITQGGVTESVKSKNVQQSSPIATTSLRTANNSAISETSHIPQSADKVQHSADKTDTRLSTTPPSPVEFVKSRFDGLREASPLRSMSPIRPQSPFGMMTLKARKEAIALEKQRESKIKDVVEKKPWFLQKVAPEPAKTVIPKRNIKQQLEMERRVRKMVSDRKCRTYRKAEIVVQLMDMNFEEEESILAANDCSTLEQAISYLQQECLLCTGFYPVSQIISMVHCPHKACRDCIRAYFTVQIRDRTIMELLCPFCNEPDLHDEDVAQDYFNHLDLMLKKLVDFDIHELFQRKLRDRVLMKDPNFRWCSQCSSGFIAMPNLKRLICPDCNAVTCASCRRPWEREHQGISCEAFAALKDASDPEAQATGLAKLLTEDGIDCPSCHFRYALAKGGCMHFRCIQCLHDFCSGCSRPFKMGQKCGVSEFCAKLGLHAHHPRNCLFYLRDKDPEDLQKLLDLCDVEYNKDPPEGMEVKEKCQVMEQKETAEGMVDDYCGKEIEDGYAGLCRIHYVEYLGQLVNKHKVDPIQIFDNDDLELVLKRASIRLPPKRYRESEVGYREKLVELILEELPIDRMDGS